MRKKSGIQLPYRVHEMPPALLMLWSMLRSSKESAIPSDREVTQEHEGTMMGLYSRPHLTRSDQIPQYDF